jgi:hydroxymethylpyrimidine pyrophosphatase-like HAD family hydrolase
MSGYFKAVALDFDGTITEGGRPTERLLGTLSQVREAGLALALVTGRVVTDLLQVFPDAERWFDIIVAENGAVLRHEGNSRALTSPVPFELDQPLVERGVYFQRGQVLLACNAEDELVVLEQVRRLEADCQLIRNRQALMVLPSGVSKASGVVGALELLGLSYHSAIAIGDAENDLALLRQCELGVAVGNAVESVKREADFVLRGNSGEAVEEFLRNRVLGGDDLPRSRRWQVALGRSHNGDRARLPASRVNVLFAGGTGVGKSFAAGLFAERLLELDYSVCVVDPEGDHAPLGRLAHVITVGGASLLPPAEDVPALLTQRLGSVVVDLSLVDHETQRPYVLDLLRALADERNRSGLPHWIIIDEAHMFLGDNNLVRGLSEDRSGLCLVTYEPGRLYRSPHLSFDFLIAIADQKGIDQNLVDNVSALADLGPLPTPPAPEEGQALFVELGDPPRVEPFKLGRRFVQHVRHWHKYVSSHLPPAGVFRFRTYFGPTGARADNLASFRRELMLCDPAVLEHHAAHRDFSRWLRHVIQDEELADTALSLEQNTELDPSLENFRQALVEAIEQRYLA